MLRPGIEPRGRAPSFTSDELSESYDELAELEPFAGAPAAEVIAPDGDALELVATLEARGGEESSPDVEESGPEEAAPASSADAETYAVSPELDLLVGILDAVRAEAPWDETEENAAAPWEEADEGTAADETDALVA